MTRRIHRSSDFDLTLEIKRDSFLRPPREAQRNWLLNRGIREFVDDLHHLDRASASFVAGSDDHSLEDRTQIDLEDGQIMEDWQIPVMRAMAEIVGVGQGDVLEIGFGRGIASSFIQQQEVRSHTIVECNDSVVARYQAWRRQYAGADIRLNHARWQDVADGWPQFDGIFFHTYPLNQDEFVEHVVGSVTFAEHFFPVAAEHLRPGGVYTYLTNEFDSLGRGHQRALFRYFDSFTLSLVEDLQVPVDTRDAMWADSMVIVRAVK